MPRVLKESATSDVICSGRESQKSLSHHANPISHRGDQPKTGFRTVQETVLGLSAQMSETPFLGAVVVWEVSGMVLGRGSQKVLWRGLAMGFTAKRGSQKGFLEEWEFENQGDGSWRPNTIREIPKLRNMNPKASENCSHEPQQSPKHYKNAVRNVSILGMPFSSVSEVCFQNFRIHHETNP